MHPECNLHKATIVQSIRRIRKVFPSFLRPGRDQTWQPGRAGRGAAVAHAGVGSNAGSETKAPLRWRRRKYETRDIIDARSIPSTTPGSGIRRGQLQVENQNPTGDHPLDNLARSAAHKALHRTGSTARRPT